MATKLTVDQLDFGKVLADTDDPSWRKNIRLDFPHRVDNVMTLSTKHGSAIITTLVRENGKPDYQYLNKTMVIIGFEDDRIIKAAYSYNSQTLVFFDFLILKGF